MAVGTDERKRRRCRAKVLVRRIVHVVNFQMNAGG